MFAKYKKGFILICGCNDQVKLCYYLFCKCARIVFAFCPKMGSVTTAPQQTPFCIFARPLSSTPCMLKKDLRYVSVYSILRIVQKNLQSNKHITLLLDLYCCFFAIIREFFQRLRTDER